MDCKLMLTFILLGGIVVGVSSRSLYKKFKLRIPIKHGSKQAGKNESSKVGKYQDPSDYHAMQPVKREAIASRLTPEERDILESHDGARRVSNLSTPNVNVRIIDRYIQEKIYRLGLPEEITEEIFKIIVEIPENERGAYLDGIFNNLEKDSGQ